MNGDLRNVRTKKFMMPFDIITRTPDELENGASPIAEYAKKRKMMYRV